MRKYLKVRWLAVIPCFLVGFAVIFQESSLSALLPLKGESEIHGRKLAGWTYFLNGNYNNALLEYEKAYSLKKDNDIAKRLGQCYLNLGRAIDCIFLLKNIAEPDYEVIATLGKAYMQQSKYADVVQVYNNAIARDIEQADFAQRIAELAARQGKKEIMEQAIKLSEKYGSPQYKTYQIQGDFYLGVQDNKKALQMHEKALAYNPRSVPSLVGIGMVYYHEGNIKNAEVQFLKAMDIEPENDAIYNNLGALYMMTGRDEEAESYFEKSLKLNPIQTEAYYNLGLIYEKKGFNNFWYATRGDQAMPGHNGT